MIHRFQAKAPGGTLVEGSSGCPMVLPKSLHAQLFLLAYDRYRCKVDGYDRWRFGLALRTAMATDLYVAGYVRDVDGWPRVASASQPTDPMLRRVLDEVGIRQPSWTKAVAHEQRVIPGLVCAELEAHGWLSTRRRRVLGIAATTRILLNDPATVSHLADQVTKTVRDGIAGCRTDERLLAVGLIAALGELPTAFNFEMATRYLLELEELVHQAIPPIRAMREVIETVHTAIRDNDTGPYSQ